MSVPMPSEQRLPPGPSRELTQAIHVLYGSAGKPGTRRISVAIKDRDDLPDTVSHEAVRNILLGNHVGWPKIQCVILQLAKWAVGKPDPEQETRKFHELWMAAEEHLTAQSVSSLGERISFDEIHPPSLNAAQTAGGDARNRVSKAQDRSTLDAPLVSWRTPAGTLDVYDRQMAIQLIKDIGIPND